jgi:hypothetical protein
MGISPHKGGGYSYDRFVSVDLTEAEGEELRKLMIEAASDFEPRLTMSELAVIAGNNKLVMASIGDENAPPFGDKLAAAKYNTLQKWATLGGVYYSVITPELDEMRCVSVETDKKTGFRNEDGTIIQNPSEKEIVHQMNKHAKQPFAMDRHFTMRDLMGKPMSKQTLAQFKALVSTRYVHDYIQIIRNLIIAGQRIKLDDPNDPSSGFNMYSDGPHGTKKNKQAQKATIEKAQYLSQIKTKPCDECGLVPLDTRKYTTSANNEAFEEFLRGFGFNIGPDHIVYLLHLEQFMERYGLLLDPDANVIPNRKGERAGYDDGHKC